MENLIVACVQPRIRVFETVEDYIDDLRRYINVAIHQDAELIVFPELLGLMIVPALMDTSRLRTDSLNGSVARSANSFISRASRPFLNAFGTDLRDGISAFLQTNAVQVSQVYADIFCSFAREYKVTIVGPSGYLADPLDGVVRNMAGVFSAQGDQLGYQSKVKLSATDKGFVSAGKSWDVIQTDVGPIGLVLGEDIFYSDVGELLARQGAQLFVSMAACDQPISANRVRSNVIARVQEMQMFGMLSHTIGNNVMAQKEMGLLTGNSAILSPQELTVDQRNVLIEISESNSEGVITAELEFEQLKLLHGVSERPTYKKLSIRDKRQLVDNIKEQMAQPLPPNFDIMAPAESYSEELNLYLSDVIPHVDATEECVLDDLPIVASISTRWPLMPLTELVEPVVFEEINDTISNVSVTQKRMPNGSEGDDETEEMDALTSGSE